jgi:hypothetical protein
VDLLVKDDCFLWGDNLECVTPRDAHARGKKGPWAMEQAMERVPLGRNDGGEAGIRTLVTLARKTAFETAAFNHSATSPRWEREV